MEKSLRCHPLDGNSAITFLAIVVIGKGAPSHPKVSNLCNSVSSYENIPGCQVTMNVLCKWENNTHTHNFMRTLSNSLYLTSHMVLTYQILSKTRNQRRVENEDKLKILEKPYKPYLFLGKIVHSPCHLKCK